ncbi:hypothetical protein SCFA_3270003 [anaerobic digester metagenome]|uniref:Uncharacterized protein n=1 Tax=anaerobic digester metagenome TaxID=1263854 RepID=A0A485M1Q6_9ZZZZ
MVRIAISGWEEGQTYVQTLFQSRCFKGEMRCFLGEKDGYLLLDLVASTPLIIYNNLEEG